MYIPYKFVYTVSLSFYGDQFDMFYFRAANPQKVVQAILAMKPEEQLQVFNMLRDSLTHRGLLAIKWKGLPWHSNQ